MPRASPRRLFLLLISLISGVLLVINILVTFNSFEKNASNREEESSMNTRKLTENLINILKRDLKDMTPHKNCSPPALGI